MKEKAKWLLIYLIIVSLQKSYITLLPSLPVYPNSYKESLIVKEEMKKDQNLFWITDLNLVPAFTEILPESPEKIHRVSVSHNHIIRFYKYLINRPRPEQVNPEIVPLPSKTANTPAYPSGHSYQAFLVAREFSKKYPHLRDQLYMIAEQCGQARIRAGLHYPSDHEFSKRLVG